MFNVLEIGKEYIRLIKAKHTDLVEDIVKYDGADSGLLECYVTDCDDNGGNTYANASELVEQVEGIEIVDTVLVMGSAQGDTRCYSNSVQALVCEDGTLWMDVAYFDLVFA
jgi:hypothetical protein